VYGLLSAEEVAGLDLGGCELAVVAACKSAVGVRMPGQGAASLQSAFHVAGARNVITALWDVHDTSSERFMKHFYAHLWPDAGAPVKHRAILDAFRAARDELRQETGIGVLDWAGFVLSGRG
jgi:CHAT domain-containing protein